jgi:hypothetical protein
MRRATQRALSTRSARADIGFSAPNTPRWPVLLTPGPLTTSAATKAAMQVDVGSRDAAFTRVVRDVRAALLAMAGRVQLRQLGPPRRRLCLWGGRRGAGASAPLALWTPGQRAPALLLPQACAPQ